MSQSNILNYYQTAITHTAVYQALLVHTLAPGTVYHINNLSVHLSLISSGLYSADTRFVIGFPLTAGYSPSGAISSTGNCYGGLDPVQFTTYYDSLIWTPEVSTYLAPGYVNLELPTANLPNTFIAGSGLEPNVYVAMETNAVSDGQMFGSISTLFTTP